MSELLGPRSLQPEETGRLQELYAAVYGVAWPRKTCLPRYLGAMAWPGAVSVMEADGRLVGAQPAYDVPLWVAGRPGTGTILVDVATHPSFRRRGVFSRLVNHAVHEAAGRGVGVVLTTPNRFSYPGFRRRPDWRLLLRLKAWAAVIDVGIALRSGTRGLGVVLRRLTARSSEFDEAHGARIDTAPLEEAPDCPSASEFDDLWSRCAPRAQVLQRRDALWIRRRFFVAPADVGYSCLTARRTGRLNGYAITRLSEVHGVPIAFLVDGLADEAVPSAGDELAEATLAWARSNRAAVLVFYGSRPIAATSWIRRIGFHLLPAFLTGRSYRVCACLPRREKQFDLLQEPAAWFMTLADSDLV